MTAAMVAGGLMARQSSVVVNAPVGTYPAMFVENKRATSTFFIDALVSEAVGLRHSAMLGATNLYALGEECPLTGAM